MSMYRSAQASQTSLTNFASGILAGLPADWSINIDVCDSSESGWRHLATRVEFLDESTLSAIEDSFPCRFACGWRVCVRDADGHTVTCHLLENDHRVSF